MKEIKVKHLNKYLDFDDIKDMLDGVYKDDIDREYYESFEWFWKEYDKEKEKEKE